jgi:hypothetical protein
MGHDIDPNDYNKIASLHLEWAEPQYALAEPCLNIMTEDHRKISAETQEEIVEKRVQERINREQENLQTRLGALEAQVKSIIAQIKEMTQQKQ